jgi:hypothetical protein
MTNAKAKMIFATHMQAARKRKLTSYELNQLAEARQLLRSSRKPAMNVPNDGVKYAEDRAKSGMGDPRPSHCRHVKANPKQLGVLIYEHVDCIYATKGPDHICDAECAKNGHRYFHEFKTRPKMYGLKDGSILIRSK